jgi:hypothetical protein
MGSAQSVLDIFAVRRREVKFVLTSEEAALIYRCVFNPNSFNFNGELYAKPYIDKDMKNSKLTVRLKEWYKKSIFKNAATESIPKENTDVSLKTVYLEHLQSILKFYENVGLRTDFCEIYVPLMMKLEGKEMEKDNPEEEEIKGK